MHNYVLCMRLNETTTAFGPFVLPTPVFVLHAKVRVLHNNGSDPIQMLAY